MAFLSLLTREADETGLLLEDVLGEGFVGAIFAFSGSLGVCRECAGRGKEEGERGDDTLTLLEM